MGRITDPDVQALASFAATLSSEYAAEDLAWRGSPFHWIKMRPSRQVGSIGEKLVAGWLATRGFDVARSPDTAADRLVNGHRVEIKLSTLWKNGGYKFQQLRDQDYELAICLGLSPFDAHCWVLPKAELLRRWRASIADGREVGGLRSQHGGATGRDTAWLAFDAAAPPDWLRPYGGTLAEAAAKLKKLARRG